MSQPLWDQGKPSGRSFPLLLELFLSQPHAQRSAAWATTDLPVAMRDAKQCWPAVITRYASASIFHYMRHPHGNDAWNRLNI